MALSPMMQQYLQIKNEYQDCILFFRLGDFYEMFFEDAEVASRELELALTGKSCGLDERAPMCGVPYHSCESYIKRLISKGHKVAICEQTEDPKSATQIVKREVVRVVTPGTLTESTMLNEGENNYLASLYCEGESAGVCFADVSTGVVYVWNSPKEKAEESTIEAFNRYRPVQLLYSASVEEWEGLANYLETDLRCMADLLPDEDFSSDCPEIAERFGDAVETVGLSSMPQAEKALAALLKYVKNSRLHGDARLNTLLPDISEQYMGIDPATVRNLELLRTIRTGEKRGSLLWVMDRTKTAMGKRLLRRSMQQPLLNRREILRRQEAVQSLLDDPLLRGELCDALSLVYDMERLMTKVVYQTVNPRELKALGNTARQMPAVKSLAAKFSAPLLQELAAQIDPMEDLSALIENALVDEPPMSVKDGNVIRDGFHEELDELRKLSGSTKEVIAELEEREREKTGIKTLRTGYNRVFGYYIEVTKSYLSQVPENYIRKQTLTNAERYITEELKDLETRALYAGERMQATEQGIFDELRAFAADRLQLIQSTASAVAYLDMLCSFATIAQDNRYCRPKLSEHGRLKIKNGRHPVVEKTATDTLFVPNDTLLTNTDSMALITGPNMAGKSTYMRQVALISVMTQMGSFVPAESAEMPVVDRLFTRVGASDDVGGGQSTFMVEMNEVAYILTHATPQSLIILDEIGRGTSTFDGMSIARAVVEYLQCNPKRRAKTLFATHYHELTELEQTLPGVKNYHIAVKKRDDDIIFLRKITPGGASRSYGIEVARLAGVPREVVTRAQEILRELETAAPQIPASIPDPDAPAAPAELLSDLEHTDLNILSPLEAMDLIHRWQKKYTGKE